MIEAPRNCWRIARADRFYCVQDAADYFRLVRDAMLRARRSIFSLGWDISAPLELIRGETPADGAPTRLDQLLVHIARRRPALRCYILTWDYGALYTLERDPLTRWRLGWRMPRGVRFGFDDHHPIGGSHHQKVVVVDDTLAFCGGIDLTGHRWDTCRHRVSEPHRLNANGTPYDPYHEVQAMATGPLAAALGELARDRWRVLGAERLPALAPSKEDLWPGGISPDITDVQVGIARTMPASETVPAIRECETLFLDSIAQARQCIYIESQYFTSDVLARALADRLRQADGPEIVVVAPKICHGWLEENTMGAFRSAAFRILTAADQHKRLRIVYPIASRASDTPTFVHSKVMVVDDVLARIGSANFSQRSLGVDSECDVAADAGDDSKARAGVRRIRHRLLGEHLDMPADDVAREVERLGSVRALVDARGTHDHTLTPIEILPGKESTAVSDLLRTAADPDEPMAFGPAAASVIPRVDARTGYGPMRLWILPAVAFAAALGVAWPSPEVVSALPAATLPMLWAAAGVFVLAGAFLVPLELLAILAGLLFGLERGAAVATAGSLAAAVFGYAAGRALGPQRIARWMSRRSHRSVRQLGTRGILGIVVLHMSTVASASAIHLAAGASRLRFASFVAGTALTVVPTAALLGGLGALLRYTLKFPSMRSALLAIGATLLLMAAAAALRGLLVIRQFAPSVSRHRERAEFG